MSDKDTSLDAVVTPAKPLRVPTVASPYLTSAEMVDYLRLPSAEALYALIREHALPVCRRGRVLLGDIRELDAWLRNQDPREWAAEQRKRA